jgi:hypothetical protein
MTCGALIKHNGQYVECDQEIGHKTPHLDSIRKVSWNDKQVLEQR